MMIVLVAGAHGRLGSRVVTMLLRRGHLVRALVRTHAQAAVLRDAGAETVVADLSGDVEWTAEGCNAAVFTASARHRSELGSIDAGGAAKLAEAADHYEFTRFVLSSVVGADRPERRAVHEFLAAQKLRGAAAGEARAGRERRARQETRGLTMSRSRTAGSTRAGTRR